MHTDISTRPTLIQLGTGPAKEEELQSVLVVHGFMMFIGWRLLLPSGILGARYLKHLNNNGWFEIHIYSQLSAIVVMLLGLLFAMAELHGYSGRSALILGFVSLVTGISQLARRDGVEHMKALQWTLFAWFLAVAIVVGYIEVQGFWSKCSGIRDVL